MKIDKKNFRHWILLIKSAAYILVGICTRPFRSKRKTVILYGHKFNGNLKAFADYLEETNLNDGLYSMAYATLDPVYYRSLKSSTYTTGLLNLSRFRDAIKVAHSDVIITSHGMHILTLINMFTTVKFVNAWHGVGWKGHTPEEFAFANKYAINWVTSPVFRDIYRDKFKISSPMEVTGYARTDTLVRSDISRQDILKKYGINDKFKNIVLIAPTWEQKDSEHTILPFGLNENNFFSPLDQFAKNNDTLIIFRTHLNTANVTREIKLTNTLFMPYGKYPIVEDFLLIADVLVTDWSTIAFDYLALERPTILLDSPCPFEVMSLNETYRFGAIVQDINQFINKLDRYINTPNMYIVNHGESMKRAKRAAYGNTLDGKSSSRYHKSIVKLIELK